jgi:hypothetical protein
MPVIGAGTIGAMPMPGFWVVRKAWKAAPHRLPSQEMGMWSKKRVTRHAAIWPRNFRFGERPYRLTIRTVQKMIRVPARMLRS